METPVIVCWITCALSGFAVIFLLLRRPGKRGSDLPSMPANSLANRGLRAFPVPMPRLETPAPDSRREVIAGMSQSALQATKPAPSAQQHLSCPSGEESPNSADNENLIGSLKYVLACHGSFRAAVGQNIAPPVIFFGVILSFVPGGLVYVLVTELVSHQAVALGVLLSAFSGFLISFLGFSHEKNQHVEAEKSKLNKAIADTVNGFPSIILAAGGPSILRNCRGIEHLICAAKAGQISDAVHLQSNRPVAFTAPVTEPTVQPAARPHRASVVLILGILGLFFPLIGPIAWIVGQGDLKAMEMGQMDRTGYDQTNAGRTCGIVGTLLYGALVLIGLANSIK